MVTSTIFLLEVGVFLTGSLSLESFELLDLPYPAQVALSIGYVLHMPSNVVDSTDLLDLLQMVSVGIVFCVAIV